MKVKVEVGHRVKVKVEVGQRMKVQEEVRQRMKVKLELGIRRSTVSSSMANQPEPCPTQMTLATLI